MKPKDIADLKITVTRRMTLASSAVNLRTSFYTISQFGLV
jgi:hypothetical protein